MKSLRLFMVLSLMLCGAGCSSHLFSNEVVQYEPFVIESHEEEINEENLEGQIILPVTNDEKISELLQKPVQQSFQEFKTLIRQFNLSDLPEFDELKNGYWVSYELFRNDNQFLSVMYTISTYNEGAAHPNHTNLSVLINRGGEQVLKLADLFKAGVNYPEVLSKLSIADLTRQAGGEQREMNQESLQWAIEWFEDGAGPDPENFQHFALTEDALVIYFPPYQVASYAEGTKIVTIPLEDIREIIREDLLSNKNE